MMASVPPAAASSTTVPPRDGGQDPRNVRDFAVGWRKIRAMSGILLCGGLLAVAGCTEKEAGEIVRYPVDERITAPSVSGELLGEAGTYDLAEHKGKVAVVNFWASWCAPCRVEADDLEAVHTELPEVEFIGVDIRDERDKAVAFVEGRVSYPSIFDPAGRIALKFSQVPPNAIPATIIIDREGRIATVIRKAVHKDELRPLVDEIAAEARS